MNNVIFSNFGVNAVLSTSLQQMWSMFSAFNVITHIPLFSVQIPPHLNVVCYFIIQITQFSFISDDLIGQWFLFEEGDDTDSKSYYFEKMGFNSHQILINIPSLIFILLVLCTITALSKILASTLITTVR